MHGSVTSYLCEMTNDHWTKTSIKQADEERKLQKLHVSSNIVEIDSKSLTMAEKILKENNIYYENIGSTQKEYFEIESELKIKIKDLCKINNEWYNNY